MNPNFGRFLSHFLSSKRSNWLRIALLSLGLHVLPTALLATPALGADRIYISYGALERSIPIDSLETYARTGKIDDNLAAYTQYADPKQLPQLRTVLMARADLSAVAISQFLYTPIGETLLTRLGQVIQTSGRQPGFYAIRAALVLAAADPQGLTLLNVLRKFPSNGIRIDLARSLQIAGDLEKQVNQTNRAIALVSQESEAQAAAQPKKIDFSQLPDLGQRGRFTWRKQTLTLSYSRRDPMNGTLSQRTFPADIYLPQLNSNAPVIVISHGLGEDRTSFQYLAEHLASYGFAVAVPEHPGSSAKQLQSLLAGRASEVSEPSEFVDRPTDIKFLLDEMQRRAQTDPTFKVNLQQVGVVGQSFGGYTALALAGASIQFEQLRKDCQFLNNSYNVSLLLQCRALELIPSQYNLRDERIKAAIAINPIDSSIFGQAGISAIKIPVMIVAGSADTVAPALPEQILPFTWLTTPKKYLVNIQGGTHFSTVADTSSDSAPLSIPPQVIGPNSAVARRYMNALSLAFFGNYVASKSQYSPYLSASYAESISQPSLGLNLITSLMATQLAEAINK